MNIAEKLVEKMQKTNIIPVVPSEIINDEGVISLIFNNDKYEYARFIVKGDEVIFKSFGCYSTRFLQKLPDDELFDSVFGTKKDSEDNYVFIMSEAEDSDEEAPKVFRDFAEWILHKCDRIFQYHFHEGRVYSDRFARWVLDKYKLPEALKFRVDQFISRLLENNLRNFFTQQYVNPHLVSFKWGKGNDYNLLVSCSITENSIHILYNRLGITDETDSNCTDIDDAVMKISKHLEFCMQEESHIQTLLKNYDFNNVCYLRETCCSRDFGNPEDYAKLVVRAGITEQQQFAIISAINKGKYRSLPVAKRLINSFKRSPDTFQERFERAKHWWGDEYIDKYHRFEKFFTDLVDLPLEYEITEEYILEKAKEDMKHDQSVDQCYFDKYELNDITAQRLKYQIQMPCGMVYPYSEDELDDEHEEQDSIS